jgi:hypothetical protein
MFSGTGPAAGLLQLGHERRERLDALRVLVGDGPREARVVLRAQLRAVGRFLQQHQRDGLVLEQVVAVPRGLEFVLNGLHLRVAHVGLRLELGVVAEQVLVGGVVLGDGRLQIGEALVQFFDALLFGVVELVDGRERGGVGPRFLFAELLAVLERLLVLVGARLPVGAGDERGGREVGPHARADEHEERQNFAEPAHRSSPQARRECRALSVCRGVCAAVTGFRRPVP